MPKHLISFVVLAILLVGCGPKKPHDLPKLYPVQLTFVQEGKPLANAQIGLRGRPSQSKYASGGSTNENGEITLHTHGQYKGVPEGEYVVIVTKSETIKEGPWDQIPKDMAESRSFMEKNANKLKQTTYSIVNKKYATADTSDLVIKVTPQGVRETLDVGKPVREKPSSPLNN